MRVDVDPDVALPPTRVTGAPKFTPSIVNCTVPVGVPVAGGTGATVAVKVTDCPNTDGLTDDVTVVVVAPFVTVNGSHTLLAPRLLGSPLYVALKLKLPGGEGVNEFELGTTPLVTGTVPAAVEVPVHDPVFQNT